MRETLRDGSLRLRGPACSFVYTRLRPGVLHLSIAGDDKDELGDAPTAAINAEFERFQQPLRLFVDTAAVTGASTAVSDRWVRWFAANHKHLTRVTIGVASPFFGVKIAISKHLSHTGELIHIVDAPAHLAAELTRELGPGVALAPARHQEPAASITREQQSDGSLRLAGERVAFTCRALRPGVVMATITGDDDGELGDAALDEIARLAARPSALFIDASAVRSVSRRVSDDWTAWLIARRPGLTRVGVLAGSKQVQFTLAIAHHRTDGWLSIYETPEQLAGAIARVVP